MNTDEGLGIALIEYEQYMMDVFKFHFNDRTTYKYVSAAEKAAEADQLRDKINEWLMIHQSSIGKKVGQTEWRNGRQNGQMAGMVEQQQEWQNGRNGYIRTIYGRRRHQH